MYTPYRGYFLDEARISAPISLVKDQYYPIEAKHIQSGGGDHFTVSLEIEPDTAPAAGHFHSQREIQRLTID